MNPRDFLQIAKDLLKIDEPAKCRTAFNRSYYAAYNVGVYLLEEAGIRISKSYSGHHELNDRLGNCGIKMLEEAQSKLANLGSQRIKADYRMNDSRVEKINNAQKVIKTSENIIQVFDSYASNSGKKKIEEGVKKYLKAISSE